MKNQKRLTAVGANIFAGGFTLGVSKYFDVLAHLEHDDYGVAVARANFPNLKIFTSLDAWPETANKKIDFLYANPPCAIWSSAGNKIGRDWTKDPRLQRVRDIFALVERYRPRVWAWESVCRAFERGRPLVEAFVDEAARLGYSASYVLVDAQYLNAPQVRKRFFLVLHRVAVDWERHRPDYAMIPPTVQQTLQGIQPVQEWLSPRDLKPIDKLPDFTRLEQELLKKTRPGEKLRDIYDRLYGSTRLNKKTGRATSRPSFMRARLDGNKSAPVLFADMHFHPTEHRYLSMNELGALHGFPPTWNWVSNQHRMTIQRGVLPPVAAWLAGVVAEAVGKDRKIARPSRTLVDFRKPPGIIRAVEKMPAQLDLDWKADAAALEAKQIKARRDVERFNRDAPRDAPERAGKLRPPKKMTADERDSRARRETRQEREKRNEETHQAIARAAKRAGSRGLPAALKEAVDYDALPVPKALLRLLPGVITSGELIRAALRFGKFTDEEIAACVRRRFEGRTTSAADVSWNRNQLKKRGEAPPDRLRR